MNIQKIQDKFGQALTALKANDSNKALSLLDSILLEAPEFTPAWNQRASFLETVGNHFDAILNYDRAISLSPTEASLYNNRGSSYLALGKYKTAIDDFMMALNYQPALTQAHSNKGNAYRRMLKIRQAADSYRDAILTDHNYADAHLGLSMCLLEQQEFEEGWAEFEWRFKSGQMPPRGLKQPIWSGEKAKNPDDILFVCGEQGFGDVLQFVRYVKFAKERWQGKVYVEVRLPLARLCKTIEGVDGVTILGEKVPDIKYHISMMSLPRVLGTEKGFHGPYMFPDNDLVSYWGKQLDQLPSGLRVGICWAGMNREDNVTASAIDARRSLSLNAFADAAKVKGIVWVSLQKGLPASQIKMPPVGMSIADLTSDLSDFYDTAALIQNLDLVISVDTAVVHLAAALGKPTWMLSRYDGCWRWFGNRPDSPWYPTLTQFRQTNEGDWSQVLEDIWRKLQQFVLESRKVAA